MDVLAAIRSSSPANGWCDGRMRADQTKKEGEEEEEEEVEERCGLLGVRVRRRQRT